MKLPHSSPSARDADELAQGGRDAEPLGEAYLRRAASLGVVAKLLLPGSSPEQGVYRAPPPTALLELELQTRRAKPNGWNAAFLLGLASFLTVAALRELWRSAPDAIPDLALAAVTWIVASSLFLGKTLVRVDSSCLRIRQWPFSLSRSQTIQLSSETRVEVERISLSKGTPRLALLVKEGNETVAQLGQFQDPIVPTVAASILNEYLASRRS